MGKASSAKKASRIAKSSGGRKVRSQQGLVFPVALVVVLTLGLAHLIYGRATNHQNLGAPALNTNTQPGDHWHTAYGIYICDQYLPNMSVGVTPDPGGIHTHQDGVIHIHPFQTATTGRNARMGDFFNQTGLNVTASDLYVEVAGEGTAVVLIHEGICDSRMWDPQWETFLPSHRVLRYDMRGFGRSPVGPGSYSNAADLIDLLEQQGVAKASLVGV